MTLEGTRVVQFVDYGECETGRGELIFRTDFINLFYDVVLFHLIPILSLFLLRYVYLTLRV